MRRTALGTLTAAALVVVTACGGQAAPGQEQPAEGRLAAAGTAKAKHVVAISVDGLNPASIKRLGKKKAPTFHKLIKKGATTLNARTEYEQTNTLPNHTGMLTGRPIRGATGHGVTFNVDNGGTVSEAAGHSVASVFTAVHDGGGTTALYTGKSKFLLFKRSWPKAVDTYVYKPKGRVLVNRVAADFADGAPTFTFIHLAMPDNAGHAHGFMGRAYLAAVRTTDRLLSRILTAIKQSPQMRSSTTLMLTADHGGLHSHRDAKDWHNFRVPFMAWGTGVPKGADLYALNPQYGRPAKVRVPYSAVKQPIRNGYVANLTTTALGLTPVPGSVFDTDQSFTVWRP